MKIGVIGGSGLYTLPGANAVEALRMETPFGSPSGDVLKVEGSRHTLFFIPRHGTGHQLLPSEINYRANIFALKLLGCRVVISISAVGSLKKEIHPGDFVLPDQYLDCTKGLRASTFFGEGVVGHVNFSQPTSLPVRRHLHGLLRRQGVRCHEGGIYICIEGPQFSSRAESLLYRSFSLPQGRLDVIGMTALPEAKLAREAGLHYQTVGMVTDFDCWNEEHEVSVEQILKVLHQNVDISKQLIVKLMEEALDESHLPSLVDPKAIVTPPEQWPDAKREMLQVLLKP